MTYKEMLWGCYKSGSMSGANNNESLKMDFELWMRRNFRKENERAQLIPEESFTKDQMIEAIRMARFGKQGIKTDDGNEYSLYFEPQYSEEQILNHFLKETK